mmetsp:Transcript_8164/g.24229  ORF Transcript_8164/g.24229 Transcript_8164/m.24229 type:complete len:148 (+) Transcript_8164:738-1181(+)
MRAPPAVCRLSPTASPPACAMSLSSPSPPAWLRAARSTTSSPPSGRPPSTAGLHISPVSPRISPSLPLSQAPAIDRGLVPQTLQTMQTPSLGSAVASRLFPLVARSPTASAAKMLAPTTLSALKTIWPSTPVNNTAPAAAAGDAAAA